MGLAWRRFELFLRQRGRELLEQLLLVAGQLLWRDHLHRHEQVTAVPAAAVRHVGHPFAAQAEDGARLRALGDREGLLAVQRRNGDLAAERQRREVDRDLAVKVVPVALEELVVLDVDHHVQVPGRAAIGSGFAFARKPQTLAAGNAGGNADGDLAILLDAAAAPARRARIRDDAAGAAALAAGPRDREEPLLVAELPTSLALRARRRLRTGGRAAAAARVARFLARKLDRGFRLLGGFHEGDLEVVPQIGAALRPAATTAGTEDVAEAEDISETTEDVLEAGEDRRIEAARCRAAKPGVPEAVVHVPLVGVCEHRVRLGRLLELLFGRLVAGIAVGVVLQRQLAVCALDLLFGRRLRNAQDLVVIALANGAHEALATLTIAGRSRRSPSR